MNYNLFFNRKAKKEWEKLPVDIREQFKRKLKLRLNEPHVPKDKLSGAKECYKIKLKQVGYRLVYQVNDNELTVLVLVVGKRENGLAYRDLKNRL